ncbi:MAG: YaiO family outer membrane beta-barrel protein [Bacteroidota bacterium]
MRNLISFFLAVLIAASYSFAQMDESLGSDELFTLAREKAFNGERDSARILLHAALKKSPSYADVRIFLARTYAWDGMRNEARNEIQNVLRQDPKNNEALSVAIDVEMWDEKPEEAFTFCLRALRTYPNDEEFLLKKARILRDLNREDEALITLSILEEINPSNPEIQRIRESIKSTFIMQGISANETYDSYSKIFDPTHLTYIQYNRSTYFGSIIGRMNYRYRAGKSGVQGEFDAYPRIMSGLYAYLNYGFAGSSSSLFPAHRAGLEAFFKLPSSFEGSFGGRYLNFGTGSDVTIYTGSLGYYYKDFWFSLRPYITPSNVSFSRSLNVAVRWYYAGSAEEYFSGKIGAGFSPDERNYDPANGNVYYLKAQSFGIGWQKPLGIYSLLTMTFDLTKQELTFNPGEYVTVYSLSAGYRYKF